jgi:hypothetical protein
LRVQTKDEVIRSAAHDEIPALRVADGEDWQIVGPADSSNGPS